MTTPSAWRSKRLPIGRRVQRAAAKRLYKPRVRATMAPHNILHIRMTSRLSRGLGFTVSAYLVGDTLIDTGFAHVRGEVARLLADYEISAICCTHHHEDHAGNAGVLAHRHQCPVYLRHHEHQWTEGVDQLLPYRQIYWGVPTEYKSEEMPLVIDGARPLKSIPIPGHSATHTAFFEEETGTLLAGDLYITSGAGAVMSHENPYESIASLRGVAASSPTLMLTGHGLAIEEPGPKLLAKADRIEAYAHQAVELYERGFETQDIVRRLFRRGDMRELLMSTVTAGEFSRSCFVRAAIKHRP